jgi:hypothetical protein
MIRVRCLWLRTDIISERVAREGGSTRSAFLQMRALVSEDRAPAGTTEQSFNVEERQQLPKNCKHRSQTGPTHHPADI